MSTKKGRRIPSTQSSAQSRSVADQHVAEHVDAHVEEEDSSRYAIMALPPKQQRFIHLYTTGQYSLQKLAELLEVHPNTVGTWLKRKDIREILEEMQQTTHDVVDAQLKSLALLASNRLRELANSPIDGVALNAVKDILDRTGYKAKQEIKIDKTVTTIEQKLANLIDATIIDAEYDVTEE